ncbi:MAG: 3-oxoacyl-ACP synthase [Treponema sp.]|jgi:3-oxoacyl-[acyl-carrier-protein] synthase-1|nr:3-oxoacyl-ACP synthase [Treponema sp.]
MKKRIFLSEPALVCCAGRNRFELYESCLSGFQGGFVMREFNNAEFPVGTIPGELPEPAAGAMRNGSPAGFPPGKYGGNTRIMRVIDCALEQLRPVVQKAVSMYGPKRVGVCFGSCDNGSEASYIAHNAFFKNCAASGGCGAPAGCAFPDDYSLRYQSASFAMMFITEKFGIKGPAFTIATACASGASAIMRGAELIKSGYCDAVIAGGADIVSQTVFTGFHALEAVSNSLTNPFSKNRKGINLGEGAAFFLLSSEKISDVELLGAGESCDAYHMTAPGIDGQGPANAMKAALLDAALDSEKIEYINLHGTGTDLNDKAESLAMKSVFKTDAPSSSTKPITGHTLGAAGALEAAICWMTLTEKKGLPAHCWDGVKDEQAPFLPAVKGNANKPSVCMSNSFAFGGCNVSLILGNNND